MSCGMKHPKAKKATKKAKPKKRNKGKDIQGKKKYLFFS